MEEILYPLLLTTAAGLASCIGFIAVFFPKNNVNKIISAALGFSAGVMIMVSLSDLMPEAQAAFENTFSKLISSVISLSFLIIGLLFALAIDHFVPHEVNVSSGNREHRDLLKVGIVSALAMALHNLPEGMATFLAGYNDKSLGISIAIAIALHNIPEGLAIALPIYYSTGSKIKSFKYVLVAALAEPLGGMIAFFLLRPFINETILGAIFALVAGIMLYISFEELLPTSRRYGYNAVSLFSVFGGICVISISTAI